MGEIYTGYVVENLIENPVKVWCPYRDGVTLYKKFKGFGKNTGNLNISDFNKILAASANCYMTSDFVSGNEYMYDSTLDAATAQENMPDMNENTLYDISRANPAQVQNEYFSPGNGFTNRSVFTNPTYNFLQGYHLGTTSGTSVNTYDNTPKGNFVHLTVGTRVLVCFPDGKNIGYILRQIPFYDKWSQMLTNMEGKP